MQDWKPIHVWELFNIEWGTTLLVLLLLMPVVRASPPSVTTNPASAIGFNTATINGALTNLGNGSSPSAPSFTLRQHKEKDCGGTLVCAIDFDSATLLGNTLVLSGQSDTAGQEYCAAPTDNGGNTWSTFFGRVNANSMGGISWVLNASSVTTITITRCGGDHLRALSVFEYPAVRQVYSPAMTLLNSGSDGYGVSLASVHIATVAIVVTITVNVGTNCATNSEKQGTYLAKVQFPSAFVNICVHSMTNITGRNNSVTNNEGGLSDYVSIDLERVFSVTLGFRWGTDSGLAGATNVTLESFATFNHSFLKALTGLTGNTVYYFQAWAYSTKGFVAGSILSFTTAIDRRAEILANTWNGFILLVFVALLTLFIIFMFWIRKKRGKGGMFGE
jgi:hypothetical protein